jgi:hypothetical protein
MKSINTLCGQNSEPLIIKVDGRYSYQWALKGKQIFNLKEYGRKWL